LERYVLELCCCRLLETPHLHYQWTHETADAMCTRQVGGLPRQGKVAGRSLLAFSHPRNISCTQPSQKCQNWQMNDSWEAADLAMMLVSVCVLFSKPPATNVASPHNSSCLKNVSVADAKQHHKP